MGSCILYLSDEHEELSKGDGKKIRNLCESRDIERVMKGWLQDIGFKYVSKTHWWKLLIIKEVVELYRIQNGIIHAVPMSPTVDSSTNASLVLFFCYGKGDRCSIYFVILRSRRTHPSASRWSLVSSYTSLEKCSLQCLSLRWSVLIFWTSTHPNCTAYRR